MERTTRSNRTFSSWAVVHSANPTFDFQASLHAAMFETAAFDEQEFDHTPFDNAPQMDATHPPLPVKPSPTTREPPPMSRMQKLKAESRARERAKKSDPTRGSRPLSKKLASRFPQDGPSFSVPMAMEDSSVTRTGFTGLRDIPQVDRTYTVQEAQSELGFTLQEWDGSSPLLIVDKNMVVCAILAGHPKDDDWSDVQRDAAFALETSFPRCSFTPERLNHRRGAFPVLQCGISYGGGQTHPMNMKNNAGNKRVLDELNKMECFRRIAGFGSGVMMGRAPALYDYYAKNAAELHQKNPDLERPFSSSIFSGVTYNGGPQTICYPHKDFANLAFGQCAVTPLGNFNPTLGGHLMLWECHLVIEFPPGSTILLPSAVITHSNCSIQPDETRYSFTQYTAGALFRWVNNQHMTAFNLRKFLSEEELEAEEKKNEARWREGLALLPRVPKT